MRPIASHRWILAALLALAGPGQPGLAPAAATATAPADPSVAGLRHRIELFATDHAALLRANPAATSTNRFQRLIQFHTNALAQLDSVPFASLDPDSKIDYLLLKNHLRSEHHQLELDRSRLDAIRPFLPFAPTIEGLLEQQRRVDPIQPRDIAQALADLARQIDRTRQELETLSKAKDPTPNPTNLPTRVQANRAARTVDDLKGSLRSWHRFYSGYHPEFSWWADESWKKVDGALDRFTSLLRHDIAGFPKRKDDATEPPADEPIIGDPLGRDALLRALESELIPYTPEELIEIAQAEFAWCDREYRRAAHDLGYGDDWKKALDHVSRLHVPPGDQPWLIKKLAEEAVQFLEDRDLVTIPDLCKEVWRMNMMTPERQRVNPFFTGGEVISVSYPTAEMNFDDKLMSLRGNNIHFSRATVQHELIPGHHLQLYMADRYQTHRKLFRTPFLIEGWALYWEMLLWDLEFPRSAEDRVGMLFWRSHRCARIIFSLKFHLGQMSAQEAIDFLVDRVGHERRNATGEVRRSFAGNYSPLYQAAYMLGGLQLRALRKELVDSGALTHRQFHDAVLQQNAIPIELIRARLANLTLTPDHRPAWRFYP